MKRLIKIKITCALIVLLVLGVSCISSEERKLKERIEFLDSMVNKNPVDTKAIIELGNVYYDVKQFGKAIIYYSRALELAPNNIDVRTDMGTCYRMLGYLKSAKQEYLISLKYDPDHLFTNFNLGVIYYMLKEKENAIFQWMEVIRLSPGSPASKKAKALIEKVKKEHAGHKGHTHD